MLPNSPGRRKIDVAFVALPTREFVSDGGHDRAACPLALPPRGCLSDIRCWVAPSKKCDACAPSRVRTTRKRRRWGPFCDGTVSPSCCPHRRRTIICCWSIFKHLVNSKKNVLVSKNSPWQFFCQPLICPPLKGINRFSTFSWGTRRVRQQVAGRDEQERILLRHDVVIYRTSAAQ